MEPLEQAFAVVEEVIKFICKSLGPDAKKHINPDRLFTRAERQINNGLSVELATKNIAGSLIPDIHATLQSKADKEKQENLSTSESHLNLAALSAESGPSTSQSPTSSEDQNNVSTREPSWSSSTALDSPQSAESQNSSSAMTFNDVSVISIGSPALATQAPVIDILDDSSPSRPSSRNSDILIVEEVEKSEKVEDKLKSEPDNPKDEEINKIVSMFHDLEKSLNLVKEQHFEFEESEGRENEVESKQFHNTAETNSDTDSEVRDFKVEVDHGPNSPDTSVINMNLLNDTSKKQMLNGINGFSIKKDLAEAKVNGFIDENRNKNSISGITNTFNENTFNHNHPDELWDDAQYVCSLLPYFHHTDVYQSMCDNYYHPDRRAYVLSQYIEIAVDRGEMVHDRVFRGLRAAKKRSHSETGSTSGDVKRFKREENSTRCLSEIKQWQQRVSDTNQLFSDSIPSTSGAVIPKVAADSTLKDNHGDFLNMDFNNANSLDKNMQETLFWTSEQKKTYSDREKWCEEKLKFISEVIPGVQKNTIRTQVEVCQTEADVERLIARLMEESPPPLPSDTQQPCPSSLISPEQPGTSAFQGPSTSAFQPFEQGNSSDSNKFSTSLSEGQPSGEAGDEGSGSCVDVEEKIMLHVKTLGEMFSDADPDYLQERCVAINGDQTMFEALVNELMENKEYPKMEEYLKRQKRMEIKKKFIEGMTVEEFLEYFEDPEKVFTDVEKKMSQTYVENARAQLMKELPYHLKKDVDNELRKHNYHYLPTLRALKDNKKLNRRKTKRTSPLKQRDLDDIFIKELCYAQMEVQIKDYLVKKDENKRRAFLWAKKNGQLQTCGCCYDDEVLEEDMDCCSGNDKHKFCCECIRRFAEEEIGQGRTNFRCIGGDCDSEFSLSTLKKVLKPAIFSNILEKKQLEEIAAAGIEDLESCPFCNFQTIMPNQEDKVFKCLNPECMKDSCRLCKEPNHVPLRCEEVEKQTQKEARTFIENKMAEAMIRECWKCKKRFIKEDGCNKMRCACGAMMCYICKKPIKGYDHFEDKPKPMDPKKCPLWSNSEKIHAEEVLIAADQVKKDLDPELKLLHDPTKDLPVIPKHLTDKPGHQVNFPPPAHQRRPHQLPPHQQRIPGQPYAPQQMVRQRLIPFPPPPPVHLNQPPPPAHQRILPAHVLNADEVNGLQHHHHHHYHHHHHRQLIRFHQQPLDLQPNPQPVREDLVGARNDVNALMHAFIGGPGRYPQPAPPVPQLIPHQGREDAVNELLIELIGVHPGDAQQRQNQEVQGHVEEQHQQQQQQQLQQQQQQQQSMHENPFLRGVW